MADQTTTATKPSRSDDKLDEALQLAIEERVKAQFDSLAPKRPLKPSRSDPDPPSLTQAQPFLGEEYSTPELDKLLSLRSHQSPGLFAAPDDPAREDFAETRYYEQMQSIDKQHHTTGSGFIKVASGGGEEHGGRCYGEIKLDGMAVAARNAVVGSNPATNDWVPASPDYDQVYVSCKPKRSESD